MHENLALLILELVRRGRGRNNAYFIISFAERTGVNNDDISAAMIFLKLETLIAVTDSNNGNTIYNITPAGKNLLQKANLSKAFDQLSVHYEKGAGLLELLKQTKTNQA